MQSSGMLWRFLRQYIIVKCFLNISVSSYDTEETWTELFQRSNIIIRQISDNLRANRIYLSSKARRCKFIVFSYSYAHKYLFGVVSWSSIVVLVNWTSLLCRENVWWENGLRPVSYNLISYQQISIYQTINWFLCSPECFVNMCK